VKTTLKVPRDLDQTSEVSAKFNVEWKEGAA
jgi:hypothetical protein